MFNVLPENLKNDIRKEYKIRLVIVTLSLFVALQMFFVVSLFPTWLSSLYKEKEVSSLIKKEQESELSRDVKNISEIIDSTNKKLFALNDTLEYPEVIPVYREIISNKVSGIKLTEFSYLSTASSSATVSLRGVSFSRENLVSFVKKLEESNKFSEVVSPVSNLAKQKNIEFVISLKVNN